MTSYEMPTLRIVASSAIVNTTSLNAPFHLKERTVLVKLLLRWRHVYITTYIVESHLPCPSELGLVQFH